MLRRVLLDTHLREHAGAAGARILMGHEATVPTSERGFVRGAEFVVDDDLAPEAPRAERIDARFVVVADGANSSFGRALGTTRHRNWPYGIATRTYFESPRHSESWIESRGSLR